MDGTRLYGWLNVCHLGRLYPREAVLNAESIAMAALSAKLVSLGYTINIHGEIHSIFTIRRGLQDD